VVILLVALNGYLFSLDSLEDFTLIRWKDNFVPKVAFWPVLLWMVAVMTLVKL
jgi:hypothetical protein